MVDDEAAGEQVMDSRHRQENSDDNNEETGHVDFTRPEHVRQCTDAEEVEAGETNEAASIDTDFVALTEEEEEIFGDIWAARVN
jgi:hypothetical protein